MPKRKIEVNENINVSIGDLLKPKLAESGALPETGRAERRSGDVNSTPATLGNEAAPNANARDPDIKNDAKKIISKFGKISLQHQRAGRGGKTVTLISISGQTGLGQNLEALLKELKKSLGCGGKIEDGKIVLQGEIADRASEWFTKMGAKNVKGS
ncbi:MAG: translation initiation factor [Synergistaceae bacterium]|nr:translation initiation factor [Synergistaceae bacterium]